MMQVWILTIMFMPNHQMGMELSARDNIQIQTYMNANKAHCEASKKWWLIKHPKKVVMAECTLQVIPN